MAQKKISGLLELRTVMDKLKKNIWQTDKFAMHVVGGSINAIPEQIHVRYPAEW